MTGPQFLFVFLDGVGLGPAIAANPLAEAQTMPLLCERLGCNSLTCQSLTCQALASDGLGHDLEHDLEQLPDERGSSLPVSGPLLFKSIDACLGIPGLPQSATGQTTLYTGHNAAAFRGKHQSAFAGGSLRQLIEPYGMLRQVLDLGGQATHANCRLPGYFEAIAQRRRRHSVGSLLTLTAGLPFRTLEDYERGEAVYWDITGEIVTRLHGVPTRSEAQAAQHLLAIAHQHHLTLFESFLPDYAGHAQDYAQAQAALQRIDRFLAALIEQLPPQITLVLSSDHGNIEDLATKQHTMNPVPLLVVGPEAPAFGAVSDLSGMTPIMLKRLRQSLSPT